MRARRASVLVLKIARARARPAGKDKKLTLDDVVARLGVGRGGGADGCWCWVGVGELRVCGSGGGVSIWRVRLERREGRNTRLESEAKKTKVEEVTNAGARNQPLRPPIRGFLRTTSDQLGALSGAWTPGRDSPRSAKAQRKTEHFIVLIVREEKGSFVALCVLCSEK
jgi:hypothetical protein